MRRKIVWLLCAAFVTGCGQGAAPKETAAPPEAVKGVATALAAAEQLPERIDAVGTVKAIKSAVIASRIAGTVAAVRVKEGERVRAGQILVELQSPETAAGAAGARASVEEARRGLNEARARARLTEATFRRYAALYNDQAVTRQEYETRQTENEVAAQGFARAEAHLLQADQQARSASSLAGYARVSAPFSGVVVRKDVDPGSTVFPGTQLMTVEETGRYRLEAAVPETLATKVRIADRLSVTIDGLAAPTMGRVAEIVPVADPATRTVIVKLDLSGKGLSSGMYGRASLVSGMRKGIVVPAAAMVERGGLTSVWVVDGTSVARMRLVKTGTAEAGKVEILSGLSAGERVVTSGVDKVRDGARVEP